MLLKILLVLTVGILGVFLGAQITEGVLFVPYWKSLAPKEFLELHQRFGKKIYQFYAPLTIVATVLPLLTLIYAGFYSTQNLVWFFLMGIFTLLFFSTYFIYFKQANNRFATANITYEELPAELKKWGQWHWGRIVLEALAFLCAIIALINDYPF